MKVCNFYTSPSTSVKKPCYCLQLSSSPGPSITFPDSIKSNIFSNQISLHVCHHEGKTSSLFLNVFKRCFLAFLTCTLLQSRCTIAYESLSLSRLSYPLLEEAVYHFKPHCTTHIPQRLHLSSPRPWLLHSILTASLFVFSVQKTFLITFCMPSSLPVFCNGALAEGKVEAKCPSGLYTFNGTSEQPTDLISEMHQFHNLLENTELF